MRHSTRTVVAVLDVQPGLRPSRRSPSVGASRACARSEIRTGAGFAHADADVAFAAGFRGTSVIALLLRATPPDQCPLMRSAMRVDRRARRQHFLQFDVTLWRRALVTAVALRHVSRASHGDHQAARIRDSRQACLVSVRALRATSRPQEGRALRRASFTLGRTVVASKPRDLMRALPLAAVGARIVSPVDGRDVVKAARDAHGSRDAVDQFPLGTAMSMRRRAALLEFAQARNAVVVEDDYDGEFRFGGRPLDALQSLDRTEAVFYIGTFSKSLFTGIRLALLCRPGRGVHSSRPNSAPTCIAR